MGRTFHPWNTTFLLTCWVAAQAVVVGACFLLAARSYPHYSMFDHDVSFLGHPRLNPAGWWFWSLGMGLGGAMLWPLATHFSRAMRALVTGQSPLRRRLVAAGTCATRCASIGLFGLALIPQLPGFDHAHELAGTLAMGGLYVAMWLFAGILVSSPQISPAKTLLLVLGMGWGPAGYLITQGWRFFVYGEVGHDVHVTPQLLLLQFSLWEWLLLLGLFSAQLAIIYCLPDLAAGGNRPGKTEPKMGPGAGN